MNKTYNFDERLDWMREQRTLLDVNFYPRIAHNGRWVVMTDSRGSEIFDKNRHVDVTMMSATGIASRQKGIQSGPHSLTIDEKIDSKNRSTILFEWWSKAGQSVPFDWVKSGITHEQFEGFANDLGDKVPGWGQPKISDADILLWAFNRKQPAGLKVYMFWLQDLIQWIIPRRNWYRVYPIVNDEWITWGYSIPIRGQGSIPADLFFGNLDGHLVRQQLDFSLFVSLDSEKPDIPSEL